MVALEGAVCKEGWIEVRLFGFGTLRDWCRWLIATQCAAILDTADVSAWVSDDEK
jgi:hypothetical protein